MTSEKKYLWLSLAVILVMWVWKIVSNVFIYDAQYFQSLHFHTVVSRALLIATITILIVWGLTYLSKENFQNLGFVKKNLLKQVLIGMLFGFVIFMTVKLIIDPLVNLLVSDKVGQESDLKFLFSNIYNLPVLMILAIYKGGFSEELWRIFIIAKFEKAFGRKGLIIALIVGSIIFGVGHLYQGLSGFISISIMGLLYALVFLRRRSAIEAITAHATYDLIAVTLGYLIYS